MTRPDPRIAGGVSPAMNLLFAVAGGAAVGNLYWAQPLLVTIAQALDISAGMAGSLVTMTQIGYAFGIMLIVPLGDILIRRRLIPTVMFCSAIALAAAASAPNFTCLLAALTAVGLTTVGGQLLVPLAGDLALPEQRGRTVGTIVGGILIGILLSRTISGFIADFWGWRAVYIIAAAVTAALSFVLARILPREAARAEIPYVKLLASVPAVVCKYSAVQVTLAIGAAGFSAFTMFWTGLTFLLSVAPFSYSLTQIGLMGIVGLAGSLAARNVGFLHDRGHSSAATGAALLVAFISLGIGYLGSTHIVPVVIAVLLFDIAIQGANVLNQTRLFSIDPVARSRLTTAFVVVNFLGGAAGSMLAGLLWEMAGWHAIMGGAMLLLGLALVLWITFRQDLEHFQPK